MSALLPCPFCGGNAGMTDLDERDDRRWWFRVVSCVECDATVEDGIGWSQYRQLPKGEAANQVGAAAAEKWNRRTTSSPVSAPATDEEVVDGVLWARFVPDWGRMQLCGRDDFGAAEYRLSNPAPGHGEGVPVLNERDQKIVKDWLLATRSHRSGSRLGILLAQRIADDLEADGVTESDIDRLFPKAPSTTGEKPAPATGEE